MHQTNHPAQDQGRSSRTTARLAGLATLLQILFLIVQLALVPTPVAAQTAFKPRPANGLALTPPMGWNSWNRFGCDIDEAKVKAQADAMVTSGLKAAGYLYVIIDDCWQGTRDEQGKILPDAKRFPNGIKAIADYVHARGLKFGIYSDVGYGTCQERPGSRGHEYQDAAQYARWEVDYLKYDWCNAEDLNARAAYATMGDALRATGRPIVFSICEWGIHQPGNWGAAVGGNLWRTSFDIWDRWSGRGNHGLWLGVLDILDLQVGKEAAAGPGRWNDPDMLEVGNGGMSDTEYRAHFALWAMLAAPLIAGNDLSTMTPSTRAILTAPGVIAIDQDALGIQGHRAVKRDGEEVWVRPLSGGATAVLLLNRSESPRRITATMAEIGLPADAQTRARDAWRPEARGTPVKGSIAADTPAHGAQLLVLAPVTAPTAKLAH
jgi:alpha-galactosidase